MSLNVGAITPVNVLTIVQISTYTASAGDFFRGFRVWGFADCEIEVQIEGTARAIGALRADTPGGLNGTPTMLVTPIPLLAAEVLRIMITRTEIGVSQDFRGELF